MQQLTTMEHHCQEILPALDRFQEAHYWIHMLEAHYHRADLFRWHLNAFLRALKEVRGILHMDLQNNQDLLEWYRREQTQLSLDPLLQYLSKKRDFVVHQSSLIPKSKGLIGVTDTRKLRLGVGFPLHALEDSDVAMKRYIEFVRLHGDPFGILIPDDDTIPCIQREWRLPEFDEEIVSLCIAAWLRVGETMSGALRILGESHDGFNLECRHDKHRYMVKWYDRTRLIDNVNRPGLDWLHDDQI